MARDGRIAIFWLGCFMVGLGAALHLPMFVMAKNMGYVLAGMPMDGGMWAGMGLIVFGVMLTAFGLLRDIETAAPSAVNLVPPKTAELSVAHWKLMLVLLVALVVDIMKPASLGFVLPGMRTEYGISLAQTAMLPFVALTGTFIGSLVWGVLADRYGRRGSILLSSVMFMGTTICGTMSSLTWNLVMCFLMGVAAGGLLPVANALLAEWMPVRHRSWSLVVVGGVGAIGGYFAASTASALLQPIFGWRVMWLLNLPTGLIIIAMSRLMPESPHFLARIGGAAEAARVMRSFGWVPASAEEVGESAERSSLPSAVLARTTILSIAALSWSLVNFGILLWLPAELVRHGYDIGMASKLLASSALIALPTVLLVAWTYATLSKKWTLVATMVITALGLLGTTIPGFGIGSSGIGPTISVAVVLFGSTAQLAVLLPYAAEAFPTAVRGRATGWIAGWTKFGGIIAQVLALLAIAPAFDRVVWGVIALLLLSIMLITAFTAATSGSDEGEQLSQPGLIGSG